MVEKMENLRICFYCKKEYELDGRSPKNRKYCYRCVPIGDEKASKKITKKIREKAHKSPSKLKSNKRALEKLKKRREMMVDEIDKLLNDIKKECSLCGYNKCRRALHYHHKIPNKKVRDLSAKGKFKNIEEFKKEVSKCVLLCANCHAEAHYFNYTFD